MELCDLLDVPHPDPHPANGYFFEFPVVEHHADGTASTGRIDLYKRACFVLESKQFQEAKAEPSSLNLPPGKLELLQPQEILPSPCVARKHGTTP